VKEVFQYLGEEIIEVWDRRDKEKLLRSQYESIEASDRKSSLQ
jgi:hypothetical protein